MERKSDAIADVDVNLPVEPTVSRSKLSLVHLEASLVRFI